ncbi:hypothetical protein [Caudoviricetes sp.]|nr:hypothetical protein [Caudoviricetes sp.]
MSDKKQTDNEKERYEEGVRDANKKNAPVKDNQKTVDDTDQKL